METRAAAAGVAVEGTRDNDTAGAVTKKSVEPVINPCAVSVAETIWLPGVPRVRLTWAVPVLNVVFGGRVAWVSVLAKRTVSKKLATVLPALSTAYAVMATDLPEAGVLAVVGR